MSMIFNLFRKSTAPDAAHEAYRSIVAQSRQPRFYAQWGVPDTVTGRFDMISLHLALLLHRLKGDSTVRPFARKVVEAFFRDMDDSIRELGVTDLGVPNRIKKMGKAFYGLAEALDPALDGGDAAAAETVLVRNIYDGTANPGAAELATYMVAEARRLASTPTASLIQPQGVAA
jgi:cytochrome b pre-mRNA-processing protein 3